MPTTILPFDAHEARLAHLLALTKQVEHLVRASIASDGPATAQKTARSRTTEYTVTLSAGEALQLVRCAVPFGPRLTSTRRQHILLSIAMRRFGRSLTGRTAGSEIHVETIRAGLHLMDQLRAWITHCNVRAHPAPGDYQPPDAQNYVQPALMEHFAPRRRRQRLARPTLLRPVAGNENTPKNDGWRT